MGRGIIYIILFSVFPTVFYCASKKVIDGVNLVGKIKGYSIIALASLISLAFFYTYSLLLNIDVVNIEYLNFCTLIFIPLSLIALLISSIGIFALIIRRFKKSAKPDENTIDRKGT